MKNFVNKLLRVKDPDGEWRISKAKVTALLGLLAPILGAGGVDFVAENIASIETALIFLMGLFIRDGITN
jgi:hypothetical protein